MTMNNARSAPAATTLVTMPAGRCSGPRTAGRDPAVVTAARPRPGRHRPAPPRLLLARSGQSEGHRHSPVGVIFAVTTHGRHSGLDLGKSKRPEALRAALLTSTGERTR